MRVVNGVLVLECISGTTESCTVVVFGYFGKYLFKFWSLRGGSGSLTQESSLPDSF